MTDEQKQEIKNRLLKFAGGNIYAIWEVTGEAQTEESQPTFLGYYEGYYYDIVEFALDLPNFVTFGNGGYVRRVTPLKLSTNAVRKRKELLERKRQTQQELDRINRELGVD